MQHALVGQANVLSLPVVAKASGNPITAGTVNFYLVDLDGDNVGKWYRGADTSWQVGESIAGASTHKAKGHWVLSLPSDVWTEEVRYLLYAWETGNLHIPVGEEILALQSVADAVHDEVIEGALTSRQMMRMFFAVLSNLSSGGGSNTLIFRDVADSKNRLTATVDKDGNRIVIIRDVS